MGVSRGQKSGTTIVSYASFSVHIMNSHLYLKRIEFYSMAPDTWTLFHQTIYILHVYRSKAMTM